MKIFTRRPKPIFLLFFTLIILYSCSKEEDVTPEITPESSCLINELSIEDNSSPSDFVYTYRFDDENRLAGYSIQLNSKIVQDYRYSYLSNGSIEVAFWSLSNTTNELEYLDRNSRTIKLNDDGYVEEVLYQYTGSERTDPDGNRESTLETRRYLYSYTTEGGLVERAYNRMSTGVNSNYEYSNYKDELRYTRVDGNAVRIEEIGIGVDTEKVRRTQVKTFTNEINTLKFAGPQYGKNDQNLIQSSTFFDENNVLDEENFHTYEFDDSGRISKQFIEYKYPNSSDRIVTYTYNYSCD